MMAWSPKTSPTLLPQKLSPPPQTRPPTPKVTSTRRLLSTPLSITVPACTRALPILLKNRPRRWLQSTRPALVPNRNGTALLADPILKRRLFEANPRPPKEKLQGLQPKPSNLKRFVISRLTPLNRRRQLTVVCAWQQRVLYPWVLLQGTLNALPTLLTSKPIPSPLWSERRKRQPFNKLRPLQPLHLVCIHFGPSAGRILPLAQVRTAFIGTPEVGAESTVHLILPPPIIGLLIPGKMPIPEVLRTTGPHLRLIMIAWPTAALPDRGRIRVSEGSVMSVTFRKTQRPCPTSCHPPSPLSSSLTTFLTLLPVRQPRRKSNRHRCVLSPPLTVTHILDRRMKSCVN